SLEIVIVIVLASLRKHEPNPSYTEGRTLSVVARRPFAIHADLDLLAHQSVDEVGRCELAALYRSEDHLHPGHPHMTVQTGH
ncbi:hypothetical protein, partial [Loktanella sp. SALINAS62]|uniref:hypothetical protein n=1 Tax=Loktanella sp. SALINAS62 TaxID=2706124 RepID=UPI001B8AAA6D